MPLRSQILNANLIPGVSQLRIFGTNGQGYAIQASSNLVDWTTLAIDAFVGDIVEWTDVTAGQHPQRFYRVIPMDALFAQPLSVGIGPGHPAPAFPVRVTGPGAQPFELQASRDLREWIGIYRGLLTEDYFDFADPPSPDLPQRFYRAIPLRQRTPERGPFDPMHHDEGFRELAARKIPFVRFSAGGFWPQDWGLYRTNRSE